MALPTMDRRGLRTVIAKRGGWLLEAEAGVLGAINIAAPDAKRPELRWPTQAVQEYLAGQRVQRSDEQLAEVIFGTGAKLAGLTTSAEVIHRLLCVTEHFFNLADAGEFPGTARPGPGRTATVAWTALVAFVKRRRIN